MDAYLQSQRIVQELVDADTDRFDLHVALAVNAFMLGEIHGELGQEEQALSFYRQAETVLIALQDRGRLAGQPRHTELLERVRARLEDRQRVAP